MGKIRVKSFGDEEQEQEEQKKKKEKREQKKTRLAGDESKRVAQNADEGIPASTQGGENEQIEPSEQAPEEKKPKPKGKVVKKFRSKSYLAAATLVDKKNKYKVAEALDLLEKLKRAKFDETVELHVNTTRTGQFGNLMLPHGTGKQTKVAIADDALIAQIETGKIDFDILLATPEMMPKLAKVARALGPRGLMPNPKNGTISKNPAEAAKEFEKGQLTVKTEGKFPVVHLTVGKVSFGKEKLADNIGAVLDLIKTTNIQAATLKSTMSPGIQIATS